MKPPLSKRVTIVSKFRSRISYLFIFLFMVLFIAANTGCTLENRKPKYVLVVHGGAGTMVRSKMSPEREAAYRKALQEALQTGYQILQKGGSSLDAVEATIRILEDSPLFNAGRGAVFTHNGRNELDASIMNGQTLAAGAVAGVTTIRNPISAARAVMERSGHVMMAGPGAEQFAREAGLDTVKPAYFYTRERWEALQKALKAQAETKDSTARAAIMPDNKFGTVGCVALDKQGHLAAGTSTGGMTNKKYGRIGDSPIIGAGTYANDEVAVSCTGWGEFYIRNVVAHDVAAMIAYKGLSVEEAAQAALAKVAASGGNGGLIALDKNGRKSMPFNTAGMYRGSVSRKGKIEISIYKN